MRAIPSRSEDNSQAVSMSRTVRDPNFARRLERACDQNPHVPPYNKGRLTWVAKQLEDRFNVRVTKETIRRWLAGETRPLPDKMRALAALLNVDEAWLSLGKTPDLAPQEARVRNIAVAGVVNYLVGRIQLDGGVCAFPADDDPRADRVHAYAIIRGAQYALHAALARETGPDTYVFSTPPDVDDLVVIGVVRLPDGYTDFLLLESDRLVANSEQHGGYLELRVRRKGGEYSTGRTKWRRITSFAERL